MSRDFTPKQKQDYYYKLSMIGATKINNKTGEEYLVSDYMRGKYHERAQNILKARIRCKEYYQNKKTYKSKNKVKRIKPVPSWYDEYLNEVNNKNSKKQVVKTASLDELRDFFKL